MNRETKIHKTGFTYIDPFDGNFTDAYRENIASKNPIRYYAEVGERFYGFPDGIFPNEEVINVYRLIPSKVRKSDGKTLAVALSKNHPMFSNMESIYGSIEDIPDIEEDKVSDERIFQDDFISPIYGDDFEAWDQDEMFVREAEFQGEMQRQT